MNLYHLVLPKTKEALATYTVINANPYREHQAIWDLLKAAPAASRSFVYKMDRTAQGLELYLLSAEELTVPEPWLCRAKEYKPSLRVGQLVRFSLRLSPQESKFTPGAARGLRQDMVMARYAEAEGAVPVQELGTMVATEWLQKRQERLGLTFIEVQASNYQRKAFKKNGATGVVPTLDVTGVCSINNPAKFLSEQAAGIGRAKFLGCGLILIKPLSG